jgi:DNA-binding PucR family transcriptional regulator
MLSALQPAKPVRRRELPAWFDARPASFVARVAASAAADSALNAAGARLLAPLLSADRMRGSDLLATLRCYYKCGGSVIKTAQAMFLHRNSVRYRLDRVRSLLQLNIDLPHNAAALIVAIELGDAA